MKTRMLRRLATLAAAGSAALVLLAVTAGVAAANTVTRLDGRMMEVGRGGVFRLPPQGPVSAPTILAAVGISALIIAVVSVVTLRMDRRSSPAQLAAVPGGPADQREAASRVAAQDRDRKAA